MSRTITYCRVSSRDQNPQLQLDAPYAHGYDQLFAEKESDQALVAVHAGGGAGSLLYLRAVQRLPDSRVQS